ncbi:hypothetical protein B0H63DRAFT_58154 [Podospora didyma]|uniref:Heterokaryon incompatibility domain-containing protein n=1 Tax=Podospora didyma TaxID=330526 RepID=A0AAE0P7L0_9PEZI|nr:hypothetical protein B0H63DRAFT_58154 [Podospora didyma]
MASRTGKRLPQTPDTCISTKKVKRNNTCDAAKLVTDVCERCRDIPWHKYLARPRQSAGTIIAPITETHEQLRTSPCPVCRGLASIQPALLDPAECFLRRFHAQQAFGCKHSKRTRKTVFLSSAVVGVAARTKKPMVGPEAYLRALGLGRSWRIGLISISSCINQNDPQEQHIRINQMDRVYSSSQLTIIAPAGEDVTHGLPGASQGRHTQQFQASAGDLSLLQIFPHASNALLSSEWATRAWTFQEGYLSKRRLIFTDCRVSFVCTEAYFAESVQRPNNGRTDPDVRLGW